MKLSLLYTIFAFASATAISQTVYENNFGKVETGKVPEDFLVIDGGFAVKEEAGNKVLELPGAPLDTYGVLFGPTEAANLCVSARMFGTAKGRLFPTFGVGLNGVGGYRLQVSPGKGKLEIYKGDAPVASIPYKWPSGTWVHLKLQSRKTAEGVVKIEGRVWKQAEAEPKEWMVSFEDKQDPPAAGRPAIWGSPYASTPIQYDDLVVAKAD